MASSNGQSTSFEVSSQSNASGASSHVAAPAVVRGRSLGDMNVDYDNGASLGAVKVEEPNGASAGARNGASASHSFQRVGSHVIKRSTSKRPDSGPRAVVRGRTPASTNTEIAETKDKLQKAELQIAHYAEQGVGWMSVATGHHEEVKELQRKLTLSENQARHLASVGRNTSADLRRQLEVSQQQTQNLASVARSSYVSNDELKALQFKMLHAGNFARSECEGIAYLRAKATEEVSYDQSEAR
jgi:hypothetical protein